MSTPAKKRRLPAWAISYNRSSSRGEGRFDTNGRVVEVKKAKVSCASNGPTSQVKGARPEGGRRRRKEETKAAGRSGSSKAKEANVISTGGGSENNDVKTRPVIKEEFDVVTDTNASKRKWGALSSTGVTEENFQIPRGISERKPSHELHANVKEEPCDTVEGVPLITDESDRRNLSPTHEIPADVKERWAQLLSEMSRKKSHDPFLKQNTDGLDYGRDDSTSAEHHVRSEETRSQHYENEKVQQMYENDLQTNTTSAEHHVRSEETREHYQNEEVQQMYENELQTNSSHDIDVSSARQKAEKENHKPLIRPFCKLLEGVVFTISGIVNPEKAELRRMALDMGAEYRPSWGSDSTLLIAAFANTPSFNQVKALGGTIVHKDWIVECYKQKELIAIEEYMMHVGNPWRAGQNVDGSFLSGLDKESPSQTQQMKAHNKETASDDHKKLLSSSAIEDGTKINESKVPSVVKNKATRADIQKWFMEDLENLRTWLEERHEKPEKEMLEYTAAQGLLACLEDAVRSLEANQGLKLVLDAWAFTPRAVKELEKELIVVSRRERLVREAERIKSIYSAEIQKMGLSDPPKEDAQTDDDATEIISDTDSQDPADYNSDDTEDLDEDEITQCQIQILQRFALD